MGIQPSFKADQRLHHTEITSPGRRGPQIAVTAKPPANTVPAPTRRIRSLKNFAMLVHRVIRSSQLVLTISRFPSGCLYYRFHILIQKEREPVRKHQALFARSAFAARRLLQEEAQLPHRSLPGFSGANALGEGYKTAG